jgi:hypothetical protein
MRRADVDDLVTVNQMSEMFGITVMYLYALTGPTNSHRDSDLFRHRIQTDETWRQAFESRASYVYRYDDVKRWNRDRQTRTKVQAAKKRNQ